MTQLGQDHDAKDASWLITQEQLDGLVSADTRHARNIALQLSSAFIAAAASLIAAAVIVDRQVRGVPAQSAVVLGAFCVLAAFIAWPVVFALHRARCRRWRQRQRECQELASVVKEIHDDTLRKLVSFNFRLMDRFIAVALSQARASFVACGVAASVALLVLLTGASAVMAAGSTGAQVTGAVLTTAGAALSAFLSVTFLRTYQMAARQLSYYYGQPLVHCYLMHAEWLAERFEKDSDPGEVWLTRQELIQAALRAGHDAQHHLLNLQGPVHPARATHDLAPAALLNGRQHAAPRNAAEIPTPR